MDAKTRKKALMGLVGGLDVVAFLGSILGGLHSVMFGIFLALAIWIIGATLVGVFYE